MLKHPRKEVLMSYVRRMIERDKNMKLTIGCRAALKKGSHWAKDYGAGRHVLIRERSGTDFAAFVLPKGFTGKLEKDIKLFDNSVAWIGEEELELVDVDFATNLSVMDWYREVEDDICGDCCETFLNEEGECSNSECPSNHLEDYYDED